VGVQSLNAGLDEAASLASLVAQSLQGGGSTAGFDAYDADRQREWRRLHGLEGIPGAAGGDDEWFRGRVGAIRASLPATGDDLECLLRHVEDDITVSSARNR
jgi:2-polyprenyl-6-methoxyphenol hydroxylase-like FAD-dependent oxidoreductase